MTMFKRARPGLLSLALIAIPPAFADDLRPQVEVQPLADEKCIEQCDIQSDKCMQDSEGDAGKLQACDEKYSECLKACERSGTQ